MIKWNTIGKTGGKWWSMCKGWYGWWRPDAGLQLLKNFITLLVMNMSGMLTFWSHYNWWYTYWWYTIKKTLVGRAVCWWWQTYGWLLVSRTVETEALLTFDSCLFFYHKLYKYSCPSGNTHTSPSTRT